MPLVREGLRGVFDMGHGSDTAATAVARTEVGMRDLRQMWTAAWCPTTREDSYRITRVEGEIPRAIHGTLYRNGPSQKILPKQGYEALHLFDGDALVHAFRFDDGEAHYTGRFVESECYLAEQAAGRYCMSGVGVQVEEPLEDFLLREQHNTNVVWHGNRLMAMVENSWPYQIDPRTLGPIGKTDLGAPQLGMSVTAHPKIEGKTGQMVIHGYQPFEPYVQWYTIEPDGKCSLAEPVDVPYATMMHDVAITESYVIFLLTPVLMDGDGLMAGKPFCECVRWEPERGLKFGVKRREAGAPVRWFESPDVGFIFHPGNAYEDGDKIVMDACTYEDGGALLETLRTFRSGRSSGDWHARPYLYEMDLTTGRCTSRKLDDRSAEFPRLDDRLVGQRNRYGYAVRGRGTGAGDDLWSVIVRYDRTGGASTAHDFGEGCWPGEPVFVPRAPDASEDDGFVLCTVYDGPRDASFLAVLDASNLDAQPLAKAHLEHRIPMGFHGNFVRGLV